MWGKSRDSLFGSPVGRALLARIPFGSHSKSKNQLKITQLLQIALVLGCGPVRRLSFLLSSARCYQPCQQFKTFGSLWLPHATPTTASHNCFTTTHN